MFPGKKGIADDYFTTRGVVNEWKARTGEELAGAKAVADLAKAGNQEAISVFDTFGSDLAEFIAPWLEGFKAEAFVIGGNIAQSWELFVPALEEGLKQRLSLPAAVKQCTLGEQAPIYGAALALTMVNTADVVPAALDESIDTSSLAEKLSSARTVLIDGPENTPWKALAMTLDARLRSKGIKAVWLDLSAPLTTRTVL